MTLKSLAMLVVLATAVGSVGCGEAIDIDRTGPNKTKKSVFDGEWYFRPVVVDKQYPYAGLFAGLEGGLDRVRWEITENELIAFRSYEYAPGTDQANVGEQQVWAVFPIISHFDVRRDYNPVNGAEGNVIVENTQDRPWWERDYVRVDWHVNLAPSYDLGGFGEFTGGVNRNSNEKAAYPWKVRIEDSDDNGEADYIETTLETGFMPSYRTCYMLDGLSPCNQASVFLKLSFLKIDQAKSQDYVPLDYPDIKEIKTGDLVRADNGEPINDSGNGGQRMCTGDEVGTDGTGIFLVVENGTGTRMCNTDAVTGDDPSDCTEIVGRCDNLAELWVAAGPEDVSFFCNTAIHDPDDCVQFTTPVFSRHGFFRTERFLYDRQEGNTLTAREKLIDRWNVWKKSRAADGSVIPMAAREPQQIVYHLNVGFPENMKAEAVAALESEWDTTFKNMVASVKGVSLIPREGANNDVDDVLAAAGVPEGKMFVIKDNSCNIAAVNKYAKDHDMVDDLRANNIDEVALGNLENACAVLEDVSKKKKELGEDIDVFHWEQLGDLRYSFVNWISKPELAGPLGYGPHAADPRTGQVISGNANIYGAALDTYSNWAADIVQLINGEITEGDIINATNAREHIEAVRNRWKEPMPQDSITGMKRLFDKRTAGMSDDQYFRQLPLTAINGGMQRLARSGLEDEYVVTDEMVRLFGGDSKAFTEGNVTQEMLDRAKPSTFLAGRVPAEAFLRQGVSPANDAAIDIPGAGTRGLASRDDFIDMMGRQSMCFFAEQVEPAIAELAAQIADQGLTREQMVQKLRSDIFVAVTLHELGHTVGLTHNFEGSADSMNFPPEYWDVTNVPAELEHIKSKSPRKDEMQYSTIMDYTQRFNSDFAGLGLYDKAAIKMGYGERVEVFDETERDFVARDWINSVFILDPQDIPYLVGGATANGRINEGYQNALSDFIGGNDNAVLDVKSLGIIPHPENIYRRRDIPMKEWLVGEVNLLFGQAGDDGRPAAVAVPYSYCSDAYAWGGNLTCNRWDKGTTSAEIVKNAGEMYEFYYPFNSFRRDRVTSSQGALINGYINRLYERTYRPMLNAFRYFYYYRRSSLRVFPAINDWSEASLHGMNFFARVLQQPDTGTYCKNTTGVYVPEAQSDDTTTCTDIGIDQGRMYRTSWNNEYDFQVNAIGNYWDKMLAIRAVTDSDAFFFRDFSSFVNRGAFSIGYYRVFQREMLGLFGALIRGDSSSLRPVLDDQGVVRYKPFLSTDIYGNPVNDPVPVGDPIEPASSYDLRVWAALTGNFLLTSTLDQTMDFAQRTRITLAGSASDPARDPSIPVRTFTNPITHVVYHSAQVDDADTAIGVQLLQEAQDIVDNEWTAAKAAVVAAEAGTDAQAIADARHAFAIVDNKLNDKTQIIDFMVLLGDMLEFTDN